MRIQIILWYLCKLASKRFPFLSITLALTYIICKATMVVAGCNFNPICNPVFFVCCTLDSQGTAAGCMFNCPIHSVFSGNYQETYQTNNSTYEFTGQSSYSAYGAAACPPEVKKVKGKGTWVGEKQGLGGTAIEEILWEAQFVTGGWATLITTTSRCNSNPWLSENAICTLESKDPVGSSFPEPFPRTARIIDETMRQSLLLAEMTKVPPVIQSPLDSSTVVDGKVVFTAHKYVPNNYSNGTANIDVVFETVVWPGTPGYKKITETINITNSTVLKLVQLDPGAWTLKAQVRSDLGSSPWSRKINITVPEQKINSLKKKGPVKFQKKKPNNISIKPQ